MLTNPQVPVMHSSSETITFRHREYICDVNSSIAFQTTRFNINPGLAASFPYLSAIAQNFQEYKFKGLVYEFKSTSADSLNSTNTSLGQVMMACQYQSDAANFVNKVQLLNEMWATDGKPSQNLILPIECDPKENIYALQYVRSGAVPTGQDQKMYDMAIVTVATQGSQAAANVGELWVTYEVELYKPKLSSGLGLALPSYHMLATSGVSTAAYFGANATNTVNFNQLGMTISTTSLIFPTGVVGTYLVTIYWNGSSTACVQPTFSFTNCVGTAVTFGGGGTKLSNSTVNNTTNLLNIFTVSITDNTVSPYVSLSGGTLPASITALDVFVTQVNGSVA